MFPFPFRKMKVKIISSPKAILSNVMSIVDSLAFRFAAWRDKTIRIEDVQEHEMKIYLLQRRLNESDYKLGQARQRRERFTTKKNELESLTAKFAAGMLTKPEIQNMVEIRKDLDIEYYNYDPQSENLHDESSVRYF